MQHEYFKTLLPTNKERKKKKKMNFVNNHNLNGTIFNSLFYLKKKKKGFMVPKIFYIEPFLSPTYEKKCRLILFTR